MVLGGGPNRIGQGIEFDYCCVHAAFALREAGYRDHHGQLQPGDRLHRLRHLGQALFRAADRRGCPGHLREGKTRRRHRAVWRPDAAEHRQRTGRRRREDPRHLAGHHRPGRGPRPLPQDDGENGHPHAGVRHGQQLRGSPADRRADRLSADGAALLRAGRPRHGSGPR